MRSTATSRRRVQGRVPALLLAFAVSSAAAYAQDATDPHRWQMTAADTPVRISEHVWMVKGNPNIAIVVGPRSALVVDTGLGPPMGAIAAGFAAKLAPGRHLFLTTTHFHPEHAAGDAGFPADTTLVRNDVQQDEVEQYGMGMVGSFASRSPENRELLRSVALRTPDLTFHDAVRLNLGGGVTVRLLWFGAAHTVGDELIFVDPDATLVSGDVVQNATIPNIFTGYGKGGTPTSWLRVLNKVAMLHPAHVVPDHSLPGDGSLVAAEQQLIGEIRSRALALKAQGVSAEQAGTTITAQLRQEHPDWRETDAAAFVRSVYADPDTGTP